MNCCNLTRLLQLQANEQPHRLALIDGRQRQQISFAQLEQVTCQTVSWLQEWGLRSGETALVFQPMSIELYVILLALFRLGMVAMFVDPSAGLSHLEQCCSLSFPRALLGSPKAHLLRLRSPVLQQIPVKVAIGRYPIPGAKRWSIQRLRHQTAEVEIAPCTLDTPALLTFTSGSTGRPKAALRTHGFLLAQHRSLSRSLQLTPGTVDLTTLPIFGLANLASGVTTCIPDADLRFPGKIDAARVLAQLQIDSPQSTAASPALLERLADYCDRQGLKLSSFQRIFSGGAPVFPRLLERLQALAPQAEVAVVYGSTEAEPIAHLVYRQIQSVDRIAMSQGAGLLVGHPVAEIQLRILPDRWGEPIPPLNLAEFEALCLPIQRVGEIVVSGEHVLSGYWQGHGDTETKFQVEGQSWHRTGDAGYLDAQGRLWLLGRCSARIQDAQGYLYPFAVEVAASFVPGIRRTAMIAHQGDRTLVVELAPAETHRPGEDQPQSLAELRQAVEWAKIQKYRLLAQIPLDSRHNAKVNYPALQQAIAKDHG
jgi:olefin beta-lactone synthetase